MRILFCKISSMKYYKGHCDEDVPVNGGKYVAEHGYGHEEYNFTPILVQGESASSSMALTFRRTARAI